MNRGLFHLKNLAEWFREIGERVFLEILQK